jgi:hypothetical protein
VLYCAKKDNVETLEGVELMVYALLTVTLQVHMADRNFYIDRVTSHCDPQSTESCVYLEVSVVAVSSINNPVPFCEMEFSCRN